MARFSSVRSANIAFILIYLYNFEVNIISAGFGGGGATEQKGVSSIDETPL